MTDEPYTIRAARFAVLSNTMQCYSCSRNTRVAALLVVDAEEHYDLKEPADFLEGPGILHYIQELDAETLEKWQRVAPWIQLRATKTSQLTYFLNTCEHCGAVQGDWYLTEPDGPFFPTRTEDLATIKVAGRTVSSEP